MSPENPGRERGIKPGTRVWNLGRPLLALWLPAAGLIGCTSEPDMGGGNWFVGHTRLEGDAAMFGPAGQTALWWQLPEGTTNWIWRVSASKETREWVVEHRYADANDDPAQGQVWWMGDSTGTWSGTITPGDVRVGRGGGYEPAMVGSGPGEGTPPFEVFTIAGVPASGNGHIEGNGELVSDELFVTLKWIKADGTVGALLKMEALGQNEQEYLQALQKMGVPPPPAVQPVR